MKQRDYITASELNEFMNSDTGEHLPERRNGQFFHPLNVGRKDRHGDVDYPIFREAAMQRETVITDSGEEKTAWVLNTPLVIKFEEDP